MKSLFTVVVLTVLGIPILAGAEPLLTHTDVFVSGEGGYFAYRIPAIETAADGSLLAFAEARKYNLNDPGFGQQDIDLVYRRSTDQGATWSPMKVIEDPGELWSAANPATAVDGETGRVWLMYLRCRPGRNTNTARPGTDDSQTLARTSDDHGLTWSEPINLSKVARDWADPKWRVSVVGPGGMIQDGRGRLVAPVWKFEPFENFVIFSDDHGRTWQRSSLVPGQGNENQLVELGDDRLLMDIRQSTGPHRWMSLSDDGGRTWGEPRPGNAVSPVCCAIERYTLKSAGDDVDRILWTGPKGPDRKQLVVRVSYDEGQTYPVEHVLDEKFAAYSDLTILRDKTVGVLWERGTGQGYEFITFTRFNKQFLELHEAKPIPPGEALGPRPYEMEWADRQPPFEPQIDFDRLDGWRVQCTDGAVAELVGSQKQRVWESPVARLVYRGTSDNSRMVLLPPKPVPVPEAMSAVTIWIYGNNWSWVPDPTTPRVTVSIVLLDQDDVTHTLDLTQVRWKEWWFVHKLLPRHLLQRQPLRVAGIQVAGAANSEDRELFFEDLAFIQETNAPLNFQPRPQRGIKPFPGQSPGANTAAGRLPFPTREETILPENHAAEFNTELVRAGDLWKLSYKDAHTKLEYELSPGAAFWNPVTVRLNGTPIARALVEAGPKFVVDPTDARLIDVQSDGQQLQSSWQMKVGDTAVAVQSTVRLWQKSLVVDCVCTGGLATELAYGHLENVEDPELLMLPYMNYGGHNLSVLMSKGPVPFFASVWLDWYRSNASEPRAIDKIDGDKILLNGGVLYRPKTDGLRNDLYERFFVTFSPVFEETLATIANPAAKRGHEAATRLWQESWGPDNYQSQHERSSKLRAYGIEMLTQCNHEIAWRDGGESFTFREAAAPGKGGDEALRRYVAGQRSLGWRSGLYTNYTDFAPVNAYWDIDHVMRRSDGNLVTAWPRCYSPKALFAVEMDRKLAPLVQRKFGTDAAYTDVHTAVAPWDRTDYDARVPGAGTFAATFYAYGELLLHDQDVYDGHCWSEGNHHWLYAGLCTGNYALTYGGLRLWEYPYLPHFDLLKMHPLSVDVGMPWTSQFFAGKDGWQTQDNIVSSIDQFLAATIAYGHIGWLVEEAHGIRQTCRSYYMLQPLQKRYAMMKPDQIRYGTPVGLVDSSEAFRTGHWRMSRLFIRYPNGLRIWVNGNGTESWQISDGNRNHDLPPFGWLAQSSDDFYECSQARDGKRYDRVSAPDLVFLDGRGHWHDFDGIGTAGSVAVQHHPQGEGVSIIAVEEVQRLTIQITEEVFGTDDVRTAVKTVAQSKAIGVRAFDQDSQDLGEVTVRRAQNGWEIQPPRTTVRLEVVP